MNKTHPLLYFTALSALLLSSAMTIAEDLEEKKASPIKTPMLNGKPDFTGVWKRPGRGLTPTIDENGSVVCILCPPAPRPKADGAAEAPRPAMPKPDRPKYKAEFMAKVKELDKRQVEFDPALRCGNPGLPRIGFPDGITQHENYIAFMYNDLNGAFFRMIPIDGRGHNPDAEETYLGDSVGKWDGDTLVIEAVNFNDETWLIDDGSFHTKDLKVTERLRRIGNTIEYQAVVEDPAVLAEPWQLRPRTMVLSDSPMYEPIPCIDYDMDHVIDGTSHDNAR